MATATRVMKTLRAAAALVLALVFLPGCDFRAYSVEDFAAFVGQDEEELRRQFGAPRRVEFLETQLPPEEYRLDQPRWDEWVERQCDHEWVYGNVHVEINCHGKIIRVRSDTRT